MLEMTRNKSALFSQIHLNNNVIVQSDTSEYLNEAQIKQKETYSTNNTQENIEFVPNISVQDKTDFFELDHEKNLIPQIIQMQKIIIDQIQKFKGAASQIIQNQQFNNKSEIMPVSNYERYKQMSRQYELYEKKKQQFQQYINYNYKNITNRIQIRYVQDKNSKYSEINRNKKPIKRKINFDEDRIKYYQNKYSESDYDRKNKYYYSKDYSSKYQSNSRNQDQEFKQNDINKMNFRKQTPISEFKIYKSQRPMLLTYCISFDSYDIPKNQLKRTIKSLGLKQQYQGQVKFQGYTNYQMAKKCVLRDVILKNTQIITKLTKFTKQRYYDPQIHLDLMNFSRGSSYYNSKSDGKIYLPLLLKLSNGLDYTYDQYNGIKVKNLTIFNKNAQIVFLNDIIFGKQQYYNRDLRNKIFLTSKCVDLNGSILDNQSFRVTFFRGLTLYGNQEAIKKLQYENILPLQLDNRCIDKFLDCTFPYRYYGYFENCNTQEYKNLKKLKSKNLYKSLSSILYVPVNIGQKTFNFMRNLLGYSQQENKNKLII